MRYTSKLATLRHNIWKNKHAYLFILPLFIFLSFFKYYTFFSAFFESLFNWNGANVNKFVGLDNYIRLFQDEIFGTSLLHVSAFTVSSVIICVTFPLAAALLVFYCINEKVRNFFKVFYVIPMVVPGMVVLMMWKWFYSYETGALNQFLKLIGQEDALRSWLGDPNTALIAIIMIGFPFIGGMQFLIYLGGLYNIPFDIFESALIDGIKWWQRLLYIELPLIRSQMKLLLMLAIISSLQVFENVLVLTTGGPGISTVVPAFYLYDQAFSYSNMGYASAIGMVLFAIILLLSIFNYKVIGKADEIN